MKPDTAIWQDRSVLITGHTGFKGSWLALWLARHGAKISGFAQPPDTDPSLYTLAVGKAGAATYFGDIADLTTVRACVDAVAPEVVFHMAAQSLVRPSYQDPVGTYATNVMGTVHLLDAVRHAGTVKAVVVVTSDKAYENREWLWAYREDEALGGHDPYSNSKGCAELVTSAYRRSFFSKPGNDLCRIATARAGNVIGGGDWSKDRLIPDIIRSLSRGESTEIRSPHAVRPWQHVLEPLSGYLRLAECLLGQDGRNYAEAWNFGPPDEDCRPVSYLVERIAANWRPEGAWHLSKGPHPHEAHFLKVDASKARARLGWHSRLSLDLALDWTTEWYRRQHDGEDVWGLTHDQIASYEGLQGI